MKKIFYLILFLFLLTPLYAFDSNWKIHPIFDEEVSHVVDTPDYVYFTSRNMAVNQWNDAFFSLFRFDKKGEEILPLSVSNVLNGYNIREVVYNAAKGYLLVLYKDFNIDLLFNNGKVINIPYYSRSDIGYDKDVNSISLDPANDRVYLATNFGCVVINDKKNEIAESRIYNVPLTALAKVGNRYLAAKDDELFISTSSELPVSFDDFLPIADFDNPGVLFPLGDDIAFLVYGKNHEFIAKGKITESAVSFEDLPIKTIFNIDYNKGGLIITSEDSIYQFYPDGSVDSIVKPASLKESSVGFSSLNELWAGERRKGLASFRKSGDDWKMTKGFMLPNSPSPFASVSFTNHPEKGLLLLNYGYNPQTLGLCESIPFELSSYKNGRWTNLAPAYTNPARTSIMMLTNGLAIDPDDSDYLYVSSCHNGFVRLNLKDPKDLIHFSRGNDPDSGKEGFVALVPASEFLPIFANFSSPVFDSNGNMWMNYADWDDQTDPNPHLFCWTREDRRATLTTGKVTLPKEVEISADVPVSNTAFVLPLLRTGKGWLLHANSRYDESLILLDTNGTPLDHSDDHVYKFPYFRDSDGNNIEVRNIRYLWEDPATGLVWIGHLNGVCHFQPSKLINGDYELTRVKVSRNDGTNLADYLLEGVTVNQMTEDAAGRKWFATAGGGVVCTSADGREIIEEFTSADSPLPDDIVYGVGYNSNDNSLLFSTSQGFAEYSLPLNSGTERAEIKAFPNPVRPEYSGFVTITDIPEGSLVKITDIAGNLVKELGIMTGFEIIWDLSDVSMNRVRSGVYLIMVSPAYEDGNFSAVGKILVIS